MAENNRPTFLESPRVNLNDAIGLRAVSFLGIPTDRGCVFRPGTSEGPDSIRVASTMYSYPGFDGELYDPERGLYLINNGSLCDVGDVADTPKDTLNARITQAVRTILDNGSIPITFGGDHSVTGPILEAYNFPFDVWQFDAHGDFQRYDEEDAAECGVVMRRVSELPNVKRIVQVGMRGFLNSGQGLRESEAKGNVVVPFNRLNHSGIIATLKYQGVNGVLRYLRDLPVYVSFDVDFLDPSICPGTTVPEPGGANYELAKKLLTELAKRQQLIGADFVELNPKFDSSGIGAIHVANLAINMVSEMQRHKKRTLV